MMQDFETLVRDVAPKCQGASELLIIPAIRDSVVELCEQARAWRHMERFTITRPGEQLLFLPPDSVLHDFGEVSHEGRPLHPKQLAWLNRWDREWRTRTEQEPRYFTQDTFQTIIVAAGQVGADISVECFLKPGQDAEEAPSELLQKYRMALVDGALSKLLAMSKQSFTDLQTAAFHLSRFDTACGRANDIYLRGEQNAPLRTRAQFL